MKDNAFLESKTWWISWVLLVVLLIVALLLPELHPGLSSLRRQLRAKQCRDHMTVIIEAEIEHYLEHRSFTIRQDALTRYRPHAHNAKCPLCREFYTIEFKDREIFIKCPCDGSNHGWSHAVAPEPTD